MCSLKDLTSNELLALDEDILQRLTLQRAMAANTRAVLELDWASAIAPSATSRQANTRTFALTRYLPKSAEKSGPAESSGTWATRPCRGSRLNPWLNAIE